MVGDTHPLGAGVYVSGGHGVRVEAAADLESAFKEALAVDGPSLVEIIADPLFW